jgi:hypothetical protein
MPYHNETCGCSDCGNYGQRFNPRAIHNQSCGCEECGNYAPQIRSVERKTAQEPTSTPAPIRRKKRPAGASKKRKFPSIIEAMIKAKRNAADNYVPTLRTDAGCILEALVAEFDEQAVLEALRKQGLTPDAYRSTLQALTEIARGRRGDRIAARQE